MRGGLLEVLTHSKRQAWQNCHRYYFNKHILRLSPRVQKRGRRRGTIFGGIQEAIQQYLPEPTRDEVYDFVWQHVSHVYEHLRESNLPADIYAELDVEERKMLVIASEYALHYGIDSRREIEYSLPLRNPQTNATSRKFKLGGKIDGAVVIGPRHARLIEDKLVSTLQRAMIDRLPLNQQITE